MKKILVALMLLFSANVFAIEPDKACFYKCDGTLIHSMEFDDYPVLDNNSVVVTNKLTELKTLNPSSNISVVIYDNNNTTCPSSITAYQCCPQGDCTIHLSKTFDFNVLSGGVNANMYVCEVGFYKLCPSCDQHYMTLVPSNEKVKTFKTFDQSNAPTAANVFINDLYWGAEFYVKYCVGVERTTVGDLTGSLAWDANITPSYTIQTAAYGSNTGYVEAADLKATVYKDCTSNSVSGGNPAQGTQVGTVLDLSNAATVNKTLPTDVLELCGTEYCKEKKCVYTLRFNEAATCYRISKCSGPGCDEWGSTIKTTFNADVTFDCIDGVCGN